MLTSLSYYADLSVTDCYWNAEVSGHVYEKFGVELDRLEMLNASYFDGFDFSTPVWAVETAGSTITKPPSPSGLPTAQTEQTARRSRPSPMTTQLPTVTLTYRADESGWIGDMLTDSGNVKEIMQETNIGGCGTPVSATPVSATPHPDYAFGRWNDGILSQDNPRTDMEMLSRLTPTAHFLQPNTAKDWLLYRRRSANLPLIHWGRQP